MIERCAIVAALDLELRPLLKRTSLTARPTDLHGCRIWRGRLAGVDVVLARTGVGRDAAERGARALCALGRPDLLIVVGVSGGLSPALAPGALFASSRLFDGLHSGHAPDPARLATLLAIDGVRPATFVTSPSILSAPAEKLDWGARVGGHDAALVDLETAGYAAAAREAGVPWIGLRSVCDPAEEPLPLDFEALRDASGNLSRTRVALRALVEPRSWGALARLRSRVRNGARAIAESLVPWIERQAGA